MRTAIGRNEIGCTRSHGGSARTDGETDHVLRMPPKRSLAAGKRAVGNLPPEAPLRAVQANLRRALGLGEAD